MHAERLQGLAPIPAELRLRAFRATEPFDYFIVTDFTAFGEQPDLVALLVRNYPTLARTSDYWIFDLRRRP